VPPANSEDLHTYLFGDNTQVIKKNDTIAYYYSKCRSFSVKFGTQDLNDIYGECKSQSLSYVSLEIAFLRRKNKLFMIILSSKDASTDLKPGTLKTIMY